MVQHSSRKKKEHGLYSLQQFHRPRLLSLLVLSFLFSFSINFASAQTTATTSSISSSTDSASSTSSSSDNSVASLSRSLSSILAPSSTSSDAASSSLVSEATTTPITIPQPFDTAQLSDTGSNFTSSSCPTFMRTFLADPSFQSCVPFSMLLYSSTGFFKLTRTGSFAITQVLDASCSASPNTCGALMDYIASQIVLDSYCGQDIKAQNPIALQAISGLQNYLLYYGAGCLKDPNTGIYCYALAITNSTNPADAASYFLPTISMLSGARPSCSSCTRELFNVYYQFASNVTLQISQNYLEAAEVVNLNCGPGYVNTTYVEKVVSAAERVFGTRPLWWMTLLWSGALGLALWGDLLKEPFC